MSAGRVASLTKLSMAAHPQIPRTDFPHRYSTSQPGRRQIQFLKGTSHACNLLGIFMREGQKVLRVGELSIPARTIWFRVSRWVRNRPKENGIPWFFGGEANALKWHVAVRPRTGSLQGPQPIASLGAPVQIQHAAHGTRDYSVPSESASPSANHLC